MEKASNERVGGPSGVNISDGFGGVMEPGSKALTLVDNHSSSHGGGWRQFVEPRRLLGKIGHTLMFDKRGACNLTEIVGALKSVKDIWSGIGSVGTDHDVGAGAVAAGRDY